MFLPPPPTPDAQDNDDANISIKKPDNHGAGILAVGIAGIAALGSLLLAMGISPGFVAQHPGEAGWDRMMNHLFFFSPFVPVGWFFFSFSRPKSRFVFWMLACTFVWLLGFAAI